MHRNWICWMTLAAVVAPAFAAEWSVDLEAAKARAAQEGKAVLISFTGSDWCSVCAMLQRNVLGLPAFAEYAKDKFVLVEIDVPRKPKFSEEQLERNHEVCAQFGVRAMPTVLVISPDGQVLGGFRGGKRTFDEACGELDAAWENGRRFAEAQGLHGMERAKALLAVHNAIPEAFRELSPLEKEVRDFDTNNATGVYDAEIAEKEWKALTARLAAVHGDDAKEDAIIAEADAYVKPGNVERLAGLKKQIAFERLERRIFSLRSTPKEALPLLDKAIEEETDSNTRYRLRAYKVEFQLRAAETLEDIQAAKQTMLDSAQDYAGNGYHIYLNAERFFSEPEKLLENAKRQRGER